jgi:hypothetical protein
MSEQRDYDLFLKGDLRVDGFQSDWLKKTLADREARGSMPRPKAVPAAPIKAPIRRSRVRRIEKDPCPLCRKPMNKNKLGLCCKCGRKWEPFISQKEVRVCKAEQCFATVWTHARHGFCGEHSRAARDRAYKLKKAA